MSIAQEVEVSLFFGDVREVTTLKDESGKREINTKMSSEVYDTLKKGEEYFATNIDVLGTDYYGYYVPLYQPGTKEVAGSVFCGRTQNQVTQSLRNTIISMAVVMLTIFLAAFIIVLFMVKRIVKSIDGAVSNLGNVAKGALQFEMKPVLLERGDEVGDIARAIQSLIHSLREILTNITSSAKALDGFSNQFAESFANITDSVDSVNTAVEEIASGATSQADETMSANQQVAEMGQALEETSANVENLHASSEKMEEYNETAGSNLEELNAHTMKDIQDDSIQMQAPYIKDVYIRDKQLENGVVNLSVDFEDRYYYEILSEMVGTNIEGEYDLISLLKELSGMRNNYESLAVACNQVRGKGYGIVPPEEKEIQIADPELIRHGNKYGVKIKASCPSMHIIQANIETEIAPIVGSEEQAKDLIDYISQNAKENPDGIFDTNIFGKTIRQLVDEGIHSKVNRLTEESQVKLQDTIQKVVNDSNGGLVCIII